MIHIMTKIEFYHEKSDLSPYGIRFSIHPYSLHEDIHSYPLYAVSGIAENKERLKTFTEK